MGKTLEIAAALKAVKEVTSLFPGDWVIPRGDESSRPRSALFNCIIKQDSIDNWDVNLSNESCKCKGDGCRECRWKEFKEIVPSHPDMLIWNPEKRVAVFIEVEDSHPLSEERLIKYQEACLWLDDVYWELILWTTDRYGNHTPHVPFDFLQRAKEIAERRMSRN